MSTRSAPLSCLFLFALCLTLGGSATPVFAKPLIGVSLVDDKDVAAKVLRVRRGFPAETAGVRAGDLILAVDGNIPISAQETADALAAAEGGKALLTIQRGAETLQLSVEPWVTPNPGLDAELFPYADPETANSGTALKARIAERDYDIISAGAFFTLARTVGMDHGYQGRRVAFRARVLNCDQLAGAPPELSQPSASPMYGMKPAQSLLFDPAAAAAERDKCLSYMDANGLDLSSPIVVIAGRVTQDEQEVFSDGGPILLIDAMLFDNSHVTLGEQVVGLVEFVDSFVRMVE